MAVVFEADRKVKQWRDYTSSLTLALPGARPAGWERQIAEPVLKEVPVSRTFLSDDSHTIGLPPRVTQPSMGRYIREVKHYRDASFGTHYGLYSGVNLLPVFGERMKNVPTAPRTHHHFGTGVNTGFQAPKLHPSVVSLKLMAGRAQWVPNPSEAASVIRKLPRGRFARKYPTEHEALFPFPRNFVPCKLPKESPAPAPREQVIDDEETVTLPMSSLLWGTPFWYNGSLQRARGPLGSPDDYGFSALPVPRDEDPSIAMRGAQVDDAGFYIPGQVAAGIIGAAARQDLSIEGKVTQEAHPKDQRGALYKKRIVPYRPPNDHYQLDPWIGQDKKSLARIGTTYKSEECRKHYSKYPPGPQPLVVLRRCDHPDLRLSVL